MHETRKEVRDEKPYQLEDDQKVSEEWSQQFQIGNLGVEDNAHLLRRFLSDDIHGLNSLNCGEPCFEMWQLKEFFISLQRKPPADAAIKLWSDAGIKAEDGRTYRIQSRRLWQEGKRKTIWSIIDKDGNPVKVNPFLVTVSRNIDTTGYGPNGWGPSVTTNNSNNGYWDAKPDLSYQNNNGGWGEYPNY